ncbi:hypothetical protein PENTCL1PPCAC_10224 [Pristionchus entomophagus]|uniref:RNase H type-1 domain-containing protein n=1 Tax=Pristionchus entomophagus TaxID=358040 RepID=A0AAV5T3A0_9BILA|nr:hypothetical protein PENTCL1PPCAC_10224 [Pristionchus entomophagus]
MTRKRWKGKKVEILHSTIILRKEIWEREEMKKTNPELIAFDTVDQLALNKDITEVLGSALYGKDGKALHKTSNAMTPEILQQLLMKTTVLSTKDLFLHLLLPSQYLHPAIPPTDVLVQDSVNSKTRVVLGRRKNRSKSVEEMQRGSLASSEQDTTPNSLGAACYVHLLVLKHLFDHADKDRAKIAADTLIANLDELDLRTLDDITANALDYLALVYKNHSRLEELKSDFDKRLQLARRSGHQETQGTIICTLVDIYALCRKYPPTDEEAPEEVTISAYSNAACIQESDCLSRPAASGIGISFGPEHPMNTSWRAPCPLKTSDAEALAAYAALAIIEHWPQYINQPITILTDCKGVVDVLRNEKKYESGRIFSVFCDRLQRLARTFPRGVEISIEHVSGHTGNKGNSRADALARKAIGLDVNMKLKPPKDKESQAVEPAKLYGEKDVEGKKAGFDNQLNWGDQWSREELEAFEEDKKDDNDDKDEDMEVDGSLPARSSDERSPFKEHGMASIPVTLPMGVEGKDDDESYESDAEMEVCDVGFEIGARW